MITYILFIIWFYILIKWADLLVDWSASIAQKFKISNIVIGLTIVAFGTSAPEFIVNIFASIKWNTDIAIWNILWSNIANILLILWVSAAIYPISAQKNTVLKEIPLSILAIFVLWLMANDILIDWWSISSLTRIDWFILIAFFIIFLCYTFSIAKSDNNSCDVDEIKIMSTTKSIIFIIIWLISLALGWDWIVNWAVKIAESFNISQSLIGLTIVAIWTSLPELATSAVAAYKKQTDIAIWNVVWSNIFNIFWVLWISAIIKPLPFNSNSNIDIFMVIFASVLLFIFMFIGKKHVIKKWQWFLMLIIYFLYIAFLILTK